MSRMYGGVSATSKGVVTGMNLGSFVLTYWGGVKKMLISNAEPFQVKVYIRPLQRLQHWKCDKIKSCIQRLAGTDLVSSLSWSVQRARGRPGRRLHSLPSERPDARPTWQRRALCAGIPWVSRAMWPNTDKRRLLMKSITGGKPVRADMSAFVTCWDRRICKIWRWHFTRNASNVFSSQESSVRVSAAWLWAAIARGYPIAMAP